MTMKQTRVPLDVTRTHEIAARERDELRAENERWREVVKTFSAGNVALEAENERLNQQAIRLFDNIYALEAEVERLQTELARWKPKACGRIFPIPVPGEAVEYCIRDYDHEGAHQARTGTTW